MKRITQLTVIILACVVLIFNLGFQKVQAASPPKKELMISSLENTGLVYAGQVAHYTVEVDAINPVDPKKSMSPYDKATVTVYFKNGDKLLQSKPKAVKNGRYTGSITLPDQGPWDVLVTALRHGEKEAKDGSNVYTMTTQWAVHPPVKRGGAWLYGFGSVLLLLLAYALVLRIRRINQKKRAK